MGIHHQPVLPAKIVVLLGGSSAGDRPLFIFKYWDFFAGLVWFRAPEQHYWAHAFLPLGISFFTFEFIHYATDRYKSKTEAGNVGEYLAFILFFSDDGGGADQALPAISAQAAH